MSEGDVVDEQRERLESALQQVRGELAAQQDHNSRLIATLREAREQIVVLKAEIGRASCRERVYSNV